MPKAKTWVVKLGGAMMTAPELGPWLAACTSGEGPVRCVVVVGGGALADGVRALHAAHGFDEVLGHELALEAMRMNARVLGALAPGVHRAAGPGATARALSAGRDVLWRPARPFKTQDLPRSWAATSDSIALWLARALDAEVAWLVKSVEPARLAGQTAAALCAAGIVDAFLPGYVGGGGSTLRVVAKSDLPLFRDARRDGDAHAAGFAPR